MIGLVMAAIALACFAFLWLLTWLYAVAARWLVRAWPDDDTPPGSR